MMFDLKSGAFWLIAVGLVVGFALWAFRLIPWWGVLVAGVAAPLIVLVLLLVWGIGMWMARGSH